MPSPTQIRPKIDKLWPISTAIWLIIKKRVGMPQFFSPRRMLSEERYRKFQKSIDKYFKFDKRKKLRNRISREIMNSTFSNIPKSNLARNPRITITKAKNHINGKDNQMISRDRSSGDITSSSQGKQSHLYY